MDNRKELAALAESDDERRTLIAALDRLERAKLRGTPANTAFLTPREQSLLKSVFPDGHTWGGTQGAQRAMAYWLPEWLTREDYFSEGVITCLRGRFYEKNSLNHRDILGALMGAGLRRDAVGDIYVRESCFECFVCAELTRYLIDNLAQAGRQHLSVCTVDPREILPPQQELRHVQASVASLRLDGIVAAGFHLSRGEAQQVVRAGTTAVDGTICLKPDHIVTVGETISVRGKGKIAIICVGGQTRRGRISVELGIYI